MITSNQPKMSGPGVPLPTKIMLDSHDTKPTNVKNGAKLKEIDTGKEFIYNEKTSSWDEQPNDGGEGGVEYEEGVFTPTEDVYDPEIKFAKEHDDLPVYVFIADYTEETPSQNSIIYFFISNWHTLFGEPSGGRNYGYTRYSYMGTSSSQGGGSNVSDLNDDTSTSSLAYYLKTTGFKPYGGASTRFYRANKTYKWYAVWAPKRAIDNAEQGDVK